MAIQRSICYLVDLDLPDPHDRLFLASTIEDVNVFGVNYIGGGSVIGLGQFGTGSDGSGQRMEIVLNLGLPNPDGLGTTIPDEVSEILGQLTDVGINLLNRGCVFSIADFDSEDRVQKVTPMLVGGVIESPKLVENKLSLTIGTTITLSREIPFSNYSYEQQVFDHSDTVYLLKRLQVVSDVQETLTW